ncbi:60S ribosomal protein L23A [Blastocystis sp. subtype 4]|uniref:60S ribosomal protein L23A n=1 Tax=Blastocystis sp. subtype 4 TaxID=944170 RepID=UPI00071157DE|nr:60S ribosomal protein L23A [Blastocystis sp. subtype 4]KNB44225.1 60S ribosomal protein L23A [Blastocystis sp. subtype 4]|eukprot:XP_014527667.1 60S ribosomal protein L23A [Blastocystis sp. subtype 4]
MVKATQAAAAAKKVQRVQKKRVGQIHTKTHFFRPHTLELARKPKYERKSVAKENKMDIYAIIKKPVVTESAMKKIESENILSFFVDLRANKKQIRNAINKLYGVKCQKVNTVITALGFKKAFVRLSGDSEAMDVANKIGIF